MYLCFFLFFWYLLILFSRVWSEILWNYILTCPFEQWNSIDCDEREITNNIIANIVSLVLTVIILYVFFKYCNKFIQSLSIAKVFFIIFTFFALFWLYLNGNFDKNFELPENPKKIIIEVGSKKEQYIIDLKDLRWKNSYTYNLKAKIYKNVNFEVARTGSTNGNFSIINGIVFDGTKKTYNFMKWYRYFSYYWYMNDYIINLWSKDGIKILFPHLSLTNAKDGTKIWIIPVREDWEFLSVNEIVGYAN